MAITHVATNEGTPTASLTSSSTVTKPSGLAVDDVMVAYTVSNLNGTSAPAGWTQILSQDSNQGSLFRVRVFYKVATSSDVAASNFVFTDSDSSSPVWAAVSAYRGVNTSNPIDAFGSTAAAGSTSQTTPSITTTHSAMILYHRGCRRASSSSLTFTSGIAHERFEGGNHDAVGYWAAMYDSGSEDDAGSISGTSITASSSSSMTDGIVTTIALRTLIVAVNANAGVATATASANTPTVELTVSPSAGIATATAIDNTAVAGIGGVAGVAGAQASGNNPDVYTTPFQNAPAGVAQASASVKQTRMDYAPAGRAQTTATAYLAHTSIGNQADTAIVYATANNASPGLGTNAGVAQAVASGLLAGPGLGSVIGVAESFVVVNKIVRLYYGSSREIDIAEETRTKDVEAENRTLMAEES